jgi:hypothetical protein
MEDEKASEFRTRISFLPRVSLFQLLRENELVNELGEQASPTNFCGFIDGPDTELDKDFLRRFKKATPRWQQLLRSINSILTSSDQSDLKALEDFLCNLREKEQKELISQYKSMAFLTDEPLSSQAKIHAEFQKAIAEEFQFFTPTELGIKLGLKKQSARQKVHRWINTGDLFTVQDGKEYIPEFEIDWEKKKPHLLIKETIEAFSESSSGWAVAYWMCQVNELLDGLRPVDVIVDSPKKYLYALNGRGRGLHN